MSWANELYQIYEFNCKNPSQPQMLPISHTLANAQLEVTISEDGEFVGASAVDKSDAPTIIPVTEKSGSRTSGVCAHPFADKLEYVAGDYENYFKTKKDDSAQRFENYINQLGEWEKSPHSHKAVGAVYKYLQKMCLMKDLIACRVLRLDEETGMPDASAKISGTLQSALFVRFIVEYNDIGSESRTWLDPTLYDSFISWNSSGVGEPQLCYCCGEQLAATYSHPKGIRHSGDGGKLISANDDRGFTYRGRFLSSSQAFSISYIFSQKMHNALKWLIARQKISIGDTLKLIIWESALKQTLNPTDDFYSANGIVFEDEAEEPPSTLPLFANQLSNAIFTRKNALSPSSKTMVMALDSATPGRVAITLYSELASSDFLENIKNWHQDTSWYRYNGKLRKTIVNSFALRELIECAFGSEEKKPNGQKSVIAVDDKLLADYICRLIPCVIEGRRLPRDLVRALARKASNPLAYEEYNFRKVREAACSMVKKTIIEEKRYLNQGDEFEMDTKWQEITDRSFLFGRLLAVAEYAEKSTYSKEEKESRVTNARRYWNRFSHRPYETWQTIYQALIPYLNKSKNNYPDILIQKIICLFTIEDFSSQRPLEPMYLLGYYYQTNSLYTSNTNNNLTSDDEEEE